MNVQQTLRTRTGVLPTAAVLTDLVLFESIFPPWAPYFIIYAALALIIPLSTGSFRFGGFLDVFRRHWKLTGIVTAAAILWDIGICTFLSDALLGKAGKADIPFYSINAALAALSEKAGMKFGISPDLAILIYAAVILFWAPIGEELFYRGYLQGNLRRNAAFTSSVLVSAAFFGIRHMTHFFFLLPDVPWVASVSWGVSAFVFGLLMSCLYEKTESLWPPVLVHALVNVCELLLSA